MSAVFLLEIISIYTILYAAVLFEKRLNKIQKNKTGIKQEAPLPRRAQRVRRA